MILPVPKGAFCSHRRMRECHKDCLHYECPDCGLTWDDGWEWCSWFFGREIPKPSEFWKAA